MKPATRRPESVLVVVATRAGEVLLLRRRRPEGYWQSVTLALGETPPQAARRELAEEAGFERAEPEDCRASQSFRIDSRFGHRYPPGLEHNTEHVFRLLLDAPRPVRLRPAEHVEYRWLPLAQALALVSSETNRLALARLVRQGFEAGE